MRMSVPGFALVVALLFASSSRAEAGRPAILFGSPQGPCYGWLDLDYARGLQNAGFEVDFTDSLDELTSERIGKYNLLVIYVTPDSYDVTMRGQKSSPAKVRAFAERIDGYVASGGGVLLMPSEQNTYKQMVSDLTDLWGARLPVEIIEETDRQNLGCLAHASHQVPLAWTDQVLPSPVSAGVARIWYPVQVAYNAQHSGPIVVDENWQVVVRGSKTTRTKAVDLARSVMPELMNPYARPEGVAEPDLFAIRTYQRGRLALVNQWRQFSVGSGTKFIFDRQVLSKGCGDRPSDFGRLLENTYRWLAEPSLAAGRPGGYVAPPDRLLPPNQRPDVRQQYAERVFHYEPAALGSAGLPADARLFRGLIGAKTTYGGGRSTVAQYADAARRAKLDFVIFLDEFARLRRETLQTLTEECRRSSSGDLTLLPGFSLPSNIGNRMFFFSPCPAWIPDYCLTGPEKKVFLIQEEDGKGGFTGYITPALDWLLSAYHVEKGQVGYFDFTDSPGGMRLHDLRLYGMAAVRYYRDGRLVEDNTEDYLTTAQCTIPPAPVSINEVASAEELTREVEAGHALVYAQARSRDRLFLDALRWTHQYDAPNVFMSDGPIVEAWPECHRVWTLGAEEFVTGSNVMPSPLAVTSATGLREIRLYNGRQLFRRFLPAGAKEFRRTLVLDGTVQKNIVLVAEDLEGRKAITFARRCWKDGGLAVSFCSDHVNDGTMALTHGPFWYSVIRHPSLPADVAGDTWDGGPLASLPLTGHQNTVPVLESDRGQEDGSRFNQIPLLEFTDEGAMAVTSPHVELFDPRVRNVVNPWNTYGPIAGPARWMQYTQRYAEWAAPTVGTPQTGWAAVGVRLGTNASLMANEIQFLEDQTIRRLELGYFSGNPAGTLVLSIAGRVEEVSLSEPGRYQKYRLGRGDWFGYYSRSAAANSNLFFNRGEPILLENRAPYVFFSADCAQRTVARSQILRFEFAAIGIPVNQEVRQRERLIQYVAGLQSPPGLEVLRGSRSDGAGLLELTPDASGAVELAMARPREKLGLTLPCRIVGLNPRWSAGLLQRCGYVKGDYGSGDGRFRALGMDSAGTAYLPLYPELAERTHVVAGHPVVAGPEGKELCIQVTQVAANPVTWHVSVNNLTDQPIRTTLRRSIDLPGLTLPDGPIQLEAGAYAVVGPGLDSQ